MCAAHCISPPLHSPIAAWSRDVSQQHNEISSRPTLCLQPYVSISKLRAPTPLTIQILFQPGWDSSGSVSGRLPKADHLRNSDWMSCLTLCTFSNARIVCLACACACPLLSWPACGIRLCVTGGCVSVVLPLLPRVPSRLGFVRAACAQGRGRRVVKQRLPRQRVAPAWQAGCGRWGGELFAPLPSPPGLGFLAVVLWFFDWPCGLVVSRLFVVSCERLCVSAG